MYISGMRMVWVWYGTGMGLVWDWYGNGMGMVWDWYGTGMGLIWDWYGTGMGMKSYCVRWTTVPPDCDVTTSKLLRHLYNQPSSCAAELQLPNKMPLWDTLNHVGMLSGGTRFCIARSFHESSS